MSAPPTPPRSRARRLPAILLALVLGVFLCEGLLWGLSLVVRVDGPRGGEGQLEAVPGLRVLCMGDSNTFGWSEPAEASYPAQLEALLNERVEGGPHQVVNLGMPGVNSRQVAERLPAELERYEPDLVLVKVGFNNRWSWTPESRLAELGAPWYESVRLVRLWRLATRSLELDRRESAQGRFLPGDFSTRTDVERDQNQVLGVDREGREVVYDARSLEESLEDERMARSIQDDLLEIAQLCEQAGAPLLLLTYCREEHDYAFANQVIRSTAGAHELPLADAGLPIAEALLPRFGFDALFFADDHPRRLGYAVCARLAYQELARRQLIQGAPLEDPLAQLTPEERPPPPLRVLGSLTGERGGPDELSIEIYDEEPARRFALFLCAGTPCPWWRTRSSSAPWRRSRCAVSSTPGGARACAWANCCPMRGSSP